MKRTRNLTLSALFAALTALGAWIRIPLPPSSLTLQILFTAMAGTLLGSRWGAVSQGVYVLLGLAGLPLFTFGGGLGSLAQPTFGFLPGMVVMAWVTGKLTQGKKNGIFRFFLSGLAGLGAMYAVGLPYLALIQNVYLNLDWSFGQIITGGMLLFLPWDLIKLALSAVLCARIRPALSDLL